MQFLDTVYIFEISGFRREVAESCALLVDYSGGNW